MQEKQEQLIPKDGYLGINCQCHPAFPPWISDIADWAGSLHLLNCSHIIKILTLTSLEVQQLRLSALNAGGLGLISGQGTRSHMLQLKILRTATQTWHRQINK